MINTLDTGTFEENKKKIKSTNKKNNLEKIRHYTGNLIREKRKEYNLTIEELSEILDIAPGFLRLIEREQRGTSIQNLHKISQFFSISLDELIGFKKLDSNNNDNLNEDEICIKSITAMLESFDSDELEYVLLVVRGYAKMRGKDTLKSYIDLQEE